MHKKYKLFLNLTVQYLEKDDSGVQQLALSEQARRVSDCRRERSWVEQTDGRHWETEGEPQSHVGLMLAQVLGSK